MKDSKRGSRAGCSSRYNGVCWDKKSGKWESYLKVNGKRINLGLFDDEREAGLAYNRAVTSRGLIGERFLNNLI